MALDSTVIPNAEELSSDGENQLQNSVDAEKTAEQENTETVTKKEDTTDEATVNNNGITTTSSGATKTASSNATGETPKPMANPLHEYATYTYGITLYILSAEDFNKLQKADANQLDAWTPTKALISSGGGHKKDRQAEFTDDFYFDNLKMETIVGMSSMTRGTNAIQLSFTVIEPYGLTLLDRIIAAAKSLGSKSYLSQPYLLEIDFHGAKELGDITSPIKNLRKRIPIQFIDMKIKAATKGSEYQIQCIPYNHSAFSENAVTTPANFEIRASTVADFFKNDTTETITTQMADKDSARQDLELQLQVQALTDEGSRSAIDQTIAQTQSVINAAYKIESYSGAVNAWNKKIIDDKHYKVANEIEILLDPEFANSKIVIPSKTSPSRSSYSGTTQADKKSSAQGNDPTISNKTPDAAYDKNTQNFNIQAGTSIVDVINMVMRNSEYIRKQVVDKTTGQTEFPQDTTVNFFKIIPQVILKDFDPLRNCYATKTIYHVKKYSYFNSKHPNLPYGTPDGAVKKYDYMYTGKNIDIIDFSIDFNTAFYTTKVVNRDNKESLTSAAGSQTTDVPDQGNLPFGSGPDSIGGVVSRPVNTQQNVSGSMADDATAILVANAMDSIYSNSRGDLINIKLKILGDPHFIKQDDLYTNPGMANYNTKKVMTDSGAIAMDNKEIFCIVNFKSPVDMDDTTGLMRLDGKYTISKFSGYYKIIKVESELSRGQFVQTLDCVRIFEKNAAAASATTNDATRQAQLDEEMRQMMAESGTRTASVPSTDTEETPTEVTPVASNGTQQEEDVVTAPVDTTNNADENLQTAQDEGQQFAADVADLTPVDIGVQETADSNSAEPQNPFAFG